MNPSSDMPDHQARVLIVDDDTKSRQLLAAMLAPEGFLVQTASSGEEALTIVARQPPDLILLDIMMLGIDGYQVAASIKGDLATKSIPVIMVTALDDRNARMLGLSAGAEDFLSKPVDRIELCLRVRNLLRLKAYCDYHDKYSQMLEGEVGSRTADLRAERDRAQRYLDTAEVMLLALEMNGRITLVNRHACSVLGWTQDELLGRNWIETCLPARIRTALTEAFHGVLRADLSVVENPILTKSGEERLIEWRNTLLRDHEGHVTGTFSSGVDVTERRRATDRLRESEIYFRSLIENSLDLTAVLAPDGYVRYTSPSVERILGYKPEEIAGRSIFEFIHREDRTKAETKLRQVLTEGNPFETLEVRLRHRDGSWRTLSVIGELLPPETGMIGLILNARDLTDSLQLEAQYRQSQKMEAVGRLAGGVAHDFNNLLTVILGYDDVLLHGLEPGPLREAAQEVRQAGERAAGLTRQLLAFSRKQTLVPEILDLGDVMSGMSTMVERLIGEEVKVSVVVSPNLGRVKADRGQLEQVVMNLAVNARDAMPKGGSLIFELQNVDLDDTYAATHADVEPGPYVLLAISDTGTGMDAETQKHIFEPFFTTKETGKGTGLGLSTVQGIVLQSGGSIGVYSEPGRGTTFKVYLPRFAGDAAVPRADSGLHPTLATESETVLVVEDEAAIRQLTKLILQKAGYTVLLAESPVAAERIAGSHPGPIHLLLTDVVMPGMRGPELAERLLRLRPDLRVLFMSGYTDDAITHHGMLDASTEFLQKPFTPNVLLRKVREVLGRGSPDAGSSSSRDS